MKNSCGNRQIACGSPQWLSDQPLAAPRHGASEMQTGGVFQPISREGSLVLNNLLLVTATATVLVGTLYPMALEGLTGEKISVGPPFFNSTFGPLMIPLLPTPAAMGVSPTTVVTAITGGWDTVVGANVQ